MTLQPGKEGKPAEAAMPGRFLTVPRAPSTSHCCRNKYLVKAVQVLASEVSYYLVIKAFSPRRIWRISYPPLRGYAPPSGAIPSPGANTLLPPRKKRNFRNLSTNFQKRQHSLQMEGISQKVRALHLHSSVEDTKTQWSGVWILSLEKEMSGEGWVCLCNCCSNSFKCSNFGGPGCDQWSQCLQMSPKDPRCPGFATSVRPGHQGTSVSSFPSPNVSVKPF